MNNNQTIEAIVDLFRRTLERAVQLDHGDCSISLSIQNHRIQPDSVRVLLTEKQRLEGRKDPSRRTGSMDQS